jgi:hypothetical protein
MRQRIRIRRDLAVPIPAILCLLLPAIAQACPVCFGEADSNQARGLQAAILVLGGITGLIVAGIAGVVLTIRRRAGKSAP